MINRNIFKQKYYDYTPGLMLTHTQLTPVYFSHYETTSALHRTLNL